MSYHVCKEEQETHITKGALDNEWIIYTTEPGMMAKLDKLCETSPEWKHQGTQRIQGSIVSRTYSCTPGMISFRSKVKAANFSEEEKAKRSARLKALRMQNKVENPDIHIEGATLSGNG